MRRKMGIEFQKVIIRRQWNDWRTAEIDILELNGLHWDIVSGGIQRRTPRPFIHGYVYCDKINGEFAHSCRHGEGPHSIKVCLIKKDNLKVWRQILAIVEGPNKIQNIGEK